MEEWVLKVASPVADSSLRIVVADRDAMGSQLLAEALGRERRYRALATPAADLLSSIESCKANLAVISADLHSRPSHGVALAEAVHRAHPQVMIVMLLDDPTRESVINSFRAGARGVFCRRETIPDFLDCIEHVKRGGIWTGRTATGHLLEAFQNIPSPKVFDFKGSDPLTKRELQVVQCAAQGKTNKAIASDLNLSEHTVKNYLFRAFEKLGVSSRIELLFYLTTRGHNSSAPYNAASGPFPGSRKAVFESNF